MKNIVPHLGQHLAQHLGMGTAGILGVRQRFQEGSDLRFGGEAHVGIVGLMREAGRRARFLGFVLRLVRHAGCHQRPASTTPAESSRLSPIMRSPIESA